jgi:hypothetical protein
MNRSGQGLAGIGTALRPHIALAAITVIAAVPIILLSYVVPPKLVLPAMSIIFLIAASILALLARCFCSDPNAKQITAWDLSGACAFIGFAAGILSTPADVLAAFGLSTGG